MPRTFLPLAAILGALLAAPGAAQMVAPEPLPDERLAKATKIYELTLPRARLDAMRTTLRPLLEAAMREAFARSDRETPEDAAERLQAILDEEFGFLMAGLPGKMAPIYAEVLTDAELDALLRLYESPEGRSVLRKLPGISSRVGATLSDDLAAFQDQILSRIDREIVAPQ